MQPLPCTFSTIDVYITLLLDCSSAETRGLMSGAIREQRVESFPLLFLSRKRNLSNSGIVRNTPDNSLLYGRRNITGCHIRKI